ncbi:MAG: 3'-5' exonuclease [Oligoflexia bacterium]|nr:3'-5' exonuclease [Oligoflexia bacterium]
MYYLFFDVETTGLLPKNYRSGFNNKSWPKIVQAAWILADKNGSIIKTANKIVAVDVPIPPEVVKIHGISDEIAREQGVPLNSVIDEFLDDLKKSNVLICHNITFDLNVLRGELIRMETVVEDCSFESFCTMKESVYFCDIPHPYYGRKWPSLNELYENCFHKKMKNAHDASADVEAVYKIFFYLKKRKIFKLVQGKDHAEVSSLKFL